MNVKNRIETPGDFEKVYTRSEVGSILKIGRVTASRLIGEGKIKGFKVGRAWRVRKTDLEEYVRRQRRSSRKGGAMRKGDRATTGLSEGEIRKLAERAPAELRESFCNTMTDFCAELEALPTSLRLVAIRGLEQRLRVK
jgi:excisionase family DNA binding protein